MPFRISTATVGDTATLVSTSFGSSSFAIPLQSGVLPGCLCLLLALVSQGVAADKFELEEGFTAFFNGEDLTGWKLRGGDSLAGKTEAPKGRFKVLDQQIVIDGKVKGNMVIDTEKPFAGDVHIKFEYQPGPGCNNDLYFRGLKFDIKQGGVKNIKEGEWNEFEIVVQGTKVEFKNNGQTQRAQDAKSDSSPLGVRAEFGSISLRRMRSK